MSLNFKRSIVINKPIEDVWKVVVEDYGQVDTWASNVHTARAWTASIGSLSSDSKSTCRSSKRQGRVCQTTSPTVATTSTELVVRSDEPDGIFEYDMLDGFPTSQFVTPPKTIWTFETLSSKDKEQEQTLVSQQFIVSELTLVGVFWVPLYYVTMPNQLDTNLHDLKYFCETEGKPSPAKQQAMLTDSSMFECM